MAKRVEVVELKTNTGDSLNDIKKLDQNMKQLNKSAKEVKKTMKDTSGVDTLEAQMNELNRAIDAGELDFQQMTKAIKDYQTIAFKAGATSPVGSKAIAQAADLRDRLKDLDTRTRQLSSDYAKMDAALQGASAAMGGFTAFQGVATLMGNENEELMKTMVKLQAATNALNGIQAVRNALNKDSAIVQQTQLAITKLQTSGIYAWATAQKVANGATLIGTKAMKLFRLALISTGIGALVVGVGLLVANFDKLKGYFTGEKKIAGWFKVAFFPLYAIIAAVKGAISLFNKFKGTLSKITDAIGLTNSKEAALAEQRKKAHKAYMKQLEAERDEIKKNIAAREDQARKEKRWSDDTIRGYEQELRAAEQSGEGVGKIQEKIFNERINQINREKEEFIQGRKDQLDLWLKDEANYVRRYGVNSKQVNDIKKKIIRERKQLETSDYQDLVDLDKSIRDVELDRTDFELDQQQKRRDAYAKAREERLAKEKEFQEKLQEIREQESERMNSLLDQIAQEEEKFNTSKRQQEENAITDHYYNLIERAREYGQDVTTLEAARDKKVKELKDGFAKEDEELRKKEIAREREAQNAITDNRLALMKEGQDKEIAALQEKYNRERIAIQENENLKEAEKLELLKQLKELEGQELAAINKKWADQEKADRIAAIQDGINAISALNDVASEIAIRRAEGDEKKQEQIARRAFNVNKALQLATATIQGIQATQNAFATASASPLAIVNPSYPFVVAGIAAATSAANIAKIASARFEGGGSVAAPSGGNVQGASASNFSIGDNTSTNQTNLNPDGTQANGSQEPVQVFVTESDITETQNNVQQVNTLSTF